ncbi:MAG TPA: YjbF family lipoprotein [Rhizomicrobium sp.]
MSRIRNGFAFGVLAAACALSGCISSDSDFDFSSAFAGAKSVFGGAPVSKITLQQAAAVPNASIAAHIGNGPEEMLVLAETSSGDQVWHGAGNVVVVLHNGHLVQTGGLADDLPNLHSESGDAVLPREAGQMAKTRWVGDFPNKNLFGVVIDCTAQAVRPEAVTSLGKQIRTMRVDETCSSPALNWTFANVYWVSPVTGVVWQSIQHFSPDYDAMTIEVLRPVMGG